MDHTAKLLLELLLMFAGGKFVAEILERLRQPPVVGEIIAGVLLGPSLLGLLHPNDLTHGLAEIGAIFLLFTIGLETKPRDVLQVGGTAALVALLGVIVPFVVGFYYFRVTDHTMVEAVFVGAALTATSVGITARVLADAGALSSRVARVILGAAVIDDIMAMIVLAVVSSLSTGLINYISLALVAVEAIGFSLLVVFFGSRVVGSFQSRIAGLRTQNAAFVLSVILCLTLSLASVHIGMAAIIGAFLAGLALADHSEKWRLQENAHPISEFLSPFFFVLLGAQVNLTTLSQSSMLVSAGILCALAIVSKLVGCGLGSLGMGWKDALRVGVGMVPRGEVGLIVAAVGLRLHSISEAVYTNVVLMSIVTTLFAPPVLRLLLPRPPELPSQGQGK